MPSKSTCGLRRQACSATQRVRRAPNTPRRSGQVEQRPAEAAVARRARPSSASSAGLNGNAADTARGDVVEPAGSPTPEGTSAHERERQQQRERDQRGRRPPRARPPRARRRAPRTPAPPDHQRRRPRAGTGPSRASTNVPSTAPSAASRPSRPRPRQQHLLGRAARRARHGPADQPREHVLARARAPASPTPAARSGTSARSPTATAAAKSSAGPGRRSRPRLRTLIGWLTAVRARPQRPKFCCASVVEAHHLIELAPLAASRRGSSRRAARVIALDPAEARGP